MLRASSEHPSQLGCGFRLLPPLLVFGQFLIPLLEKSLTLPSLPPPLQNGMPFVNFPRSQLQLCDLCSSLYHNSPVSSFELPWQLSWLRIRLQCRRPLFDSWVGKIRWRSDRLLTPVFSDFPGGSAGKESAHNVGDPGSIPESGRSPKGGNGNLLQYSYLENPMNREAWQITVHGIMKSWIRLND